MRYVKNQQSNNSSIMKKIKKIASTAKKSARIVSMTAAVATMCTNLGLGNADADAAQAAYEEMANEFGGALIIEMNPLGGFIA